MRCAHMARLAWLALVMTVQGCAPAQARVQPEAPLRCAEGTAAYAGDVMAALARDFKPGEAPRIFFALGKDRYPALKKLLAAGENPNVCHAGISPLMLAAASGDAQAVGVLLDAGALPDRPRDSNGATVLHYALSAPQFPIATLLLERGADPRIVADGNKTTLHSLVLQPTPATPELRALQRQMAARLLRLQVPLDAFTNQKSNALFMSIGAGNLELMRYLLEQGANPGLTNKRGENALAYARRLGHAALVTQLEQRPALP